VTETDAFGNPLPGPAAPSAPPVATATAPPPPVPPVPALPTYAPTKTGWGERLVALFVIALFVAPFAIGGWFAWNAMHTAKSATTAIKNIGLAPSTPADDHGDHRSARTPAAPQGVTGTSLLAAKNLDRALAAARRDPGGRLVLLRLAPARADLQLARHGGGLDLLQLRSDGGRSLIKTPGTGPRNAIIFSKIDRAAPARLVRQAAHRLGRSTKAIDYVVLIDVLGGPNWSAYFQGGAAFQGDAHGHVVRRIQ
jgi:hypothetical protein